MPNMTKRYITLISTIFDCGVLIGYKVDARPRIYLGGVKCRLMTMMFLQIAPLVYLAILSFRGNFELSKCETWGGHPSA